MFENVSDGRFRGPGDREGSGVLEAKKVTKGVRKMKKPTYILAIIVLVCVVATALPVYAQGPVHTGAPDIHSHFRDDPFTVIPGYCDGYYVRADVVRNEELTIWLNEDGSPSLERWNSRMDVTLTNSESGTFANVMIRFRLEFDYNANTTTMSGIRSALVNPDGGLQELSNVGRVVISGISPFEGDVLSAAGRWATVTDHVFDHRAWPCEVVAD